MTRKTVNKQNVIIGALTGSAGIFITKFLGLLYLVPFNEMAQGDSYFYGNAYQIYNYALNICQAGLPFAIATVVAKYAARDDYPTIMLVRKIARRLLSVLGILSFLVVFLGAGVLSNRIVPAGSDPLDFAYTQTTVRIVSFALIFVPVLSYYRGFYQGMKEMKIYSFTQVLEQLIRVGFLLGAGAICVYIMKLARIWAVYMAVVSTSLSAIGCIIYFLKYDREYMSQIDYDHQAASRYSGRDILLETIGFAIPYLLSAVIANASNMFILLMFKDGLQAGGVDGEKIKIYQTMITLNTEKIVAIPQILLLAFQASLVPHLASAMARENIKEVRDVIHKVILTVNYLAIPLLTFMIIFSKPIYHFLLGSLNLEEADYILRRMLAIQYLYIPSCVLASTLITLRKRKQYLIMEAVRLLFVLLFFKPFLTRFGIKGYFFCKIIEFTIIIVPSIRLIHDACRLNMKYMESQLVKIVLSCVPILVIGIVAKLLGFNPYHASRVRSLLYCLFNGILCMASYLYVSARVFNQPKELLGLEFTKDGLQKFLSSFR